MEEERAESPVYAFSKLEASRHTFKFEPEGQVSGRTLESRQEYSPTEKSPLKVSKILRDKLFLTPDIAAVKPCSCPQVMVVDDGFNLLTIETLLKSLNVSYESALSGVECLKRFQQSVKCQKKCKRYGLIFMDGNMPIKDGLATTRELISWNDRLSITWKLRIVGCTAYVSEEKAQEFEDAGALEHLTKPLNKSDLIKVLEKYKII